MIELDHTHRADAVSWVASAQDPDTDFPIQNLPLGVFRRDEETPRIGIAIGDRVLDLQGAFGLGLLPQLANLTDACSAPHLNALMTLGRPAARRLRRAVFDLLAFDSDARRHADVLLIGMNEVQMLVPAQIGDFTDFFTSIHHARRTGEMFRPDTPLQPNFKHLPVAYHGRASSVVASGTPCVRPRGQLGMSPEGAVYTPTQRLDFELEVGFYIGPGNVLGASIGIDASEQQVFGLCLVNDWSARDIQRWESQPLGPFLAKSFMTSVSPWVVTLDALAPFRCPVPARAEGEPPVSRALNSEEHALHGAIDIALSVHLQTARMRSEGKAPAAVARPGFADQYWSIFQMLTHHASNGCNLRSGDLLSSGTVSGAEREHSGCLLELTNNGKEPLVLPNRESRSFLEDGDMVEFRGRCARDGYRSIGFGVCRGTVAPTVQ
jgi:fumarylacetoacetase